uniref:DHC_N2 domain-containing protein n=1 Tax=Heterorhabditis bacteriophora TaxID=37862 RepID=A0A1I7XFM7_HETBA
MKKVEVKPRGGKNIKDTYQNLKPWRMQLIEAQAKLTTTSPAVITLEPIYDKTSGVFYSQEELLKLCMETKSIARQFGIKDVSTFASNNCGFIRLYYPNVTCQQINVFLQYCENIVH